ncbi:MAG: hypothetical protein DA408_17205 [Bacteroidetes bacterium]|nr:MAG: hypothetical protein C7N36_14280 [Bacteroidota bacterium]PTM09966.1 MAG: hypothetical protein DA408_17205 [Bacteroidota bacterium]
MKQLLLVSASLLLTGALFGQLFYTDVANAWGINHSYLSTLLGGGVSCYDFDDDGWDDITLATAQGDPIQFYRNVNGQLQRLPALISNEDEAKQILWVDFDNDGDQDLFVATYDGLNRLYEQQAPWQFTDITLQAGLPSFNTRTYGACFGDYDRDGWLDLYFGLRVPFQVGENRHFLFHNNGDGTFSDVTGPSGTIDQGGIPFCSVFLDYNNDGWPDLYTAHDRNFNPNTLLENRSDGTFRSVGAAAGANLYIDAMSVTVGDCNRDGLLDIYCTNLSGESSKLLLNQGPDSLTGQYAFREDATAAGVGFYGMGWGASFLDADNDGDLDLYVSGSEPGSMRISAAFLLNEDDGTFSQPAAGFSGDTTISYNNAIGDFNNDGYPEILVGNTYPFRTQLWTSPAQENNWIKVKLRGIVSNRNAIGSRIECYSNGHYQQRYTQCGNGFLGQNSGTETIGLAAATVLDSLVITWPSGHVDKWYDIATGQTYQLVEGGTNDGVILPNTATTPILLTVSSEETGPRFSVYPSPARHQLIVTIPPNARLRFAIFSTSGTRLRDGNLIADTTSLDISALAQGVYFLVLQDEYGQRQCQRWIKQE